MLLYLELLLSESQPIDEFVFEKQNRFMLPVPWTQIFISTFKFSTFKPLARSSQLFVPAREYHLIIVLQNCVQRSPFPRNVLYSSQVSVKANTTALLAPCLYTMRIQSWKSTRPDFGCSNGWNKIAVVQLKLIITQKIYNFSRKLVHVCYMPRPHAWWNGLPLDSLKGNSLRSLFTRRSGLSRSGSIDSVTGKHDHVHIDNALCFGVQKW